MSENYRSLRAKYEAEKARDDSEQGQFGKQVFDFTGKEVKFWKPEVGTHVVDIIPFISKNKFPTTKWSPGCTPGDIQHKFEYWVHRGVGPNKDSYLCNYRMGLGSCPICEEYYEELQAKKESYMRENGLTDKEAYKAVVNTISVPAAKHRVMYHVNTGTPDEPVMEIFDAPYAWSEKEFKDADALEVKSDPDRPHFADPINGFSIKFSVATEEFNNREFNKITFRDFRDRKGSYAEGIESRMIDFSSLAHIPTISEITDSMNGVITDDEPEEDYTSPKQEVVEKSEPPKAETAKSTEMTREERIEKMKAKKSQDTETCPMGGEFGEDYCSFDFCEECPLEEACGEASGVILG